MMHVACGDLAGKNLIAQAANEIRSHAGVGSQQKILHRKNKFAESAQIQNMPVLLALKSGTAGQNTQNTNQLYQDFHNIALRRYPKNCITKFTGKQQATSVLAEITML